MKIDEAINKCRDLAYGECEPNPYYGMPYFEDKEYEQLAEWLEELKALNQTTQMVDKSNFSQDQYKADTDTAYQCGYTKGIEDFVEKIMEYCSMSDMNKKMIGQIAEDLKERSADNE